MDRRRFLKGTALAAAAAGTPFGFAAYKDRTERSVPETGLPQLMDNPFTDTNAYLFCYPFRNLKYGATEALLKKVNQHQAGQVWVSSFESLFHKNIDHVNTRLVRECREKGDGMLVPFGTVNPAFPDWEEDLRRCHEEHEMPGLRLYPGYHGYTLEEDKFTRLLSSATELGMMIQIVIAMEDERMMHPLVDVPAVEVSPLPGLLNQVPDARVQLIHPFRHIRGDSLRLMIEETNVTFDISNLDFAGALELIMKGDHAYVQGTSIPAERLMFGSHMPYFPLENVLFKFMESRLTEEDAQLIMKNNAERLLTAV